MEPETLLAVEAHITDPQMNSLIMRELSTVMAFLQEPMGGLAGPRSAQSLKSQREQLFAPTSIGGRVFIETITRHIQELRDAGHEIGIQTGPSDVFDQARSDARKAALTFDRVIIQLYEMRHNGQLPEPGDDELQKINQAKSRYEQQGANELVPCVIDCEEEEDENIAWIA